MTHAEMEAQRRDEQMALRLAKYSDVMPYSNIFFVGAMDFAKSAFDNFIEMSAQTRHSLVYTNFQLLQCLDGAYASLKNFPNELAVMASYTTYVNEEILDQFFSGCPEEYENDEVVRNFRKNVEVIKAVKLQFRKVKPSIEEFIAIFGLALWNGYTADLSVETARIVRTNRKALLLELQKVYARDGNTRYTSRMAEVFGLLVNTFREIQKAMRCVI
ncbi:hypothetical protein PRIPAC_97498 [Pristionchus pacificus]|uniref:Nuclear receptor n=1 Tax=Pristionchus pacificus TaxID=54126 RepID=A0A2A6D2I0_PRIPA|nr:hypothetical protein PRIPAC_97498 [Pristionchus pacificus]|eukprot:PDM84491.1 nuclear receptor [Pristionchus pacificus]